MKRIILSMAIYTVIFFIAMPNLALAQEGDYVPIFDNRKPSNEIKKDEIGNKQELNQTDEETRPFSKMEEVIIEDHEFSNEEEPQKKYKAKKTEKNKAEKSQKLSSNSKEINQKLSPDIQSINRKLDYILLKLEQLENKNAALSEDYDNFSSSQYGNFAQYDNILHNNFCQAKKVKICYPAK